MPGEVDLVHGGEQAAPNQIGAGGIAATLEDLHRRLDAHFQDLATRRKALEIEAPVFALEHGLEDAELQILLDAVRAAVSQGFGTKYRKSWLPFVVYAAESGYGYIGDEYWKTFAEQTPRWSEVGDRDWIRYKFIAFADSYSGIRPRGAFAQHFPIIAWPITHAVLPTYLQRNLAQLLYDFSSGLTSDLLGDPAQLGIRLAARASSYTERFRIFCENALLLGSVAVSLLGESDESPLLLPSTLHRLIADLSREQESRHWLNSARIRAKRLREREREVPRSGAQDQPSEPVRISSPRFDPKLNLREREGKWQLWVELPDLSPLTSVLPEGADGIRGRHARIQGLEGLLARDRHLYPGQKLKLKEWPRAGAPFLTLEGAPKPINQLLAQQCSIGSGPVWLFRLGNDGTATEIKGRVIRPGQQYILVRGESSPHFGMAGLADITLEAGCVRAAIWRVPEVISATDLAAMTAAGFHVNTGLSVRPVGLVPSSWDGESEIEWLAGEHASVVVSANVETARCELKLDDHEHRPVEWPQDQTQIILEISDLAVGRHELVVQLVAPDDSVAATETLFITIRDPLVRPEGATSAEGVRLLASPVRPSLASLWDGHATLQIEGPPNAIGSLGVTLKSEAALELASVEEKVKLPVPESEWPELARRIREKRQFSEKYDEAESVEVTVSLAGIGFARLTCDRGFQPLRWKVVSSSGGIFSAHLIDRTAGNSTRVELLRVERPTTPIEFDSHEPISVPPLGGCLCASSEGIQQSTILPTQPNALIHAGRLRPTIESGRGDLPIRLVKLAEFYRIWKQAERPGDVFAETMQSRVLQSISQQAVSLVAGKHWVRIERRLWDAEQPMDLLGEARSAVGIDKRQKEVAARIARSLWIWSTPIELIDGFHKIMFPYLQTKRLEGVPTAFLLQLADLAGSFGDILDWNRRDRAKILNQIIKNPVVLRAARFAVLGARMFVDEAEAARGF